MSTHGTAGTNGEGDGGERGGGGGGARRGALRRPMAGRSPAEEHRASTPLELLFDLCFVVAVSQAAAGLHHALVEDHAGPGVLGYAMVFFAIWWAWMNFTWFASSYDTDDVFYRLMTLVQMSGALVLAAGVQDVFAHYDLLLVTAGYVIMRMAMVTQWLRAAAEDPGRRRTALRYALGITLVQAGWVARLALPYPADRVGFAVLAVAEIAVPGFAERRRRTPWHPSHIAERYGLFTLIVLGEVILATLVGVRTSLTEQGTSAPLLMVAAGSLLLVFALWWFYFSGPEPELTSIATSLAWGYGHYLLFAGIAALGAGLEVAVETAAGHGPLGAAGAALTVAVPAALFLLVLPALHRVGGTGSVRHQVLAAAGAAAVLALAALAGTLGLPGAVLGMGLAAALTLALSLALGRAPAGAGRP